MRRDRNAHGGLTARRRSWAPEHPRSETDMQDIYWLALILGLTVLSLGYIRLADRA